MIERTEGEKSYAVIIDESILNEIHDLTQLHNRVKLILGHKNIALQKMDGLSLNPLVYDTASTTSASVQGLSTAQKGSDKALQSGSITESQSEVSLSTHQKDDSSMPYPPEESLSSGKLIPISIPCRRFFFLFTI